MTERWPEGKRTLEKVCLLECNVDNAWLNTLVTVISTDLMLEFGTRQVQNHHMWGNVMINSSHLGLRVNIFTSSREDKAALILGEAGADFHHLGIRVRSGHGHRQQRQHKPQRHKSLKAQHWVSSWFTPCHA